MARVTGSAATAAEDLSEALYVRVTKSDKAALDDLAGRLPLKSASIARIALRIGLQAIDKDPSAIFGSKKGRR
jgi:hypothetical protein